MTAHHEERTAEELKMKKDDMPLVPKRSQLDDSLLIITGFMVMVYIISNILSVKVIEIGGVSFFDAGTITFPLAYMLGDVLTEIWGFKTARKIIWLTFFCNAAVILLTSIGCWLPAPDYMYETNEAFHLIFSYVPRIIGASLIGFVAGELFNAWSFIEIRKRTGFKWLWVRTIGSSVAGYLLDTVLFVLLAFGGTVPFQSLFSMIVIQYFFKMGIEIVLSTPMAYGMIRWLRRQLVQEQRGENK